MNAALSGIARPDQPGPLTWRTWAGLVLLPVLVMGLFLWAFWSPEAQHGAAKAAVVNNDKPVTVDGQTIPLGRQLAANLTGSQAAYTWVLTDADDAGEGLARGDYGAVVTIPEDFSAKATSSAQPDAMATSQAVIRVQASNATSVVDPIVSAQIAEIALRTLNQQIVSTYLDKVYLSMGTVHDQLGKAADGAAQLADGADTLAGGARQLTAGTGQLASGLNGAQAKVTDARNVVTELQRQLQLPPPPRTAALTQIEALAAGVDTAASGANRVNDGAQQLSGGLSQLSSGAHELADELAQGRDQVPVYTEAERKRLSNAVATPALAVTDTTDLGAAVAAVAVTLALWSGALSTYVTTRAVPRSVLASRRSTRRIVAAAVLPGALLAVIVAVSLSLILTPVLHLSLVRWCVLLGVTALTALTFIALNQSIVAVMGRVGRFISIAVLVLTIVTNLTSTIPAPLHTIGGYLPTRCAIHALRGAIIGSDTVPAGLTGLIAWLSGAAVVTLLVTERRRILDSRQLRLGRLPVAAS